MNGDID